MVSAVAVVLQLSGGEQTVVDKCERGTEARVLPSIKDSCVALQVAPNHMRLFSDDDSEDTFQPHRLNWSGTPSSVGQSTP